MQTPTCPKCGDAIAPADVNVASNVAFCRACNYSASLSDLTRGLNHNPNVDLGNPPPGTWYRDNGTEKVVGASSRSAGKAIGMMFLAIIWIAGVSIFVLFVLAASLRNLGKPMPDWLPGLMAKSGSDISGGMTICMWLFLTPFILIGIALPFAMLMHVAGHTEVRITDMRGTVFNGIGPIGRRWRFNPADVTAVRVAEKRLHGHTHDSDTYRDTFAKFIAIDLRNAEPISFGFSLEEKRMIFIVSALNARAAP